MSAWTALALLFLALVAGGLIGLDRTYRGRAAGLRTYGLVCLASSMLMIATALPGEWLAAGTHGMLVNDPTRVVQGIMTGIGFLGAGVIVREGFSLHGLTTAASIWITAAIGILIGSGLLIPGAVATLMTVILLAAFKPLEDRLPAQRYLHVDISCPRDSVLPESELRRLLREHDFRVSQMSYSLGRADMGFTYEMILWTHSDENIRRLVLTLRRLSAIETFRISPTKD